MKRLVIAIDGPAASGKSTVAKLVAKKLNYCYIDTGAMYRCFTLYVLENKIDPYSEEDINKHIHNASVIVDGPKAYLNGKDVSNEIRSTEVTRYVSTVCAYASVRDYMVTAQRKIADSSEKSVILDGRDIGTIVFPSADLKIFLTANYDVRAERRYNENLERGITTPLETIKEDLMRRDKADSTRDIAPLSIAYDAIVLDNSDMDAIQTADFILDRIAEIDGDIHD